MTDGIVMRPSLANEMLGKSLGCVGNFPKKIGGRTWQGAPCCPACSFYYFLLVILQLRQPCCAHEGKAWELQRNSASKRCRAAGQTLGMPASQPCHLWDNETPTESQGFYGFQPNTACFQKEICECAENVTPSPVCCLMRVW